MGLEQVTTIRMHQEREYPHRVSGTALQNPDLAAYAQAFGGHGARVEPRGGAYVGPGRFLSCLCGSEQARS